MAQDARPKAVRPPAAIRLSILMTLLTLLLASASPLWAASVTTTQPSVNFGSVAVEVDHFHLGNFLFELG